MEQTKSQILRPQKVLTALKLLYLTLGIGIIRIFLEDTNLFMRAESGINIFVLFLIFALVFFIYYLIGKGKNWARIIFLIFFIVGFPLTMLQLLPSLSRTPFSGLLGLVQVTLTIIALVNLFHKESNKWFRHRVS